MTRVLLVGCYELGRQPFGLASPAAWLREAGAEVECLDLAIHRLEEAAVRGADVVAFHVPMHTATRLAARAIPRVRALNPEARVAAFGLYAAMNAEYLRSLGATGIMGGEFESALVAFALGRDAAPDAPVRAARGAAPPAVTPPAAARPDVSLERLAFRVPDRSGLPPLERYAKLVTPDGTMRVVGATEASRGCKHRCRHCPIVPVYDGRFRIVQRDIVLADVRQLVGAGATHVTFGDPDFWNGIGHAMPLVEALHREHPHVTYDATIKVEHLLKHREHLGRLRETGCLFVTSAVESLDDAVLAKLEKGHTRADVMAALTACDDAGLALVPTFVAFTPWTTRASHLDLLRFIAEWDLVRTVASIQLAIRLLIPRGSRLLELDDVRRLAGPFDPEALVHPWRHPDPDVDALQAATERMVGEATSRGAEREDVFASAWDLARGATGAPAAAAKRPARAPVPYLTEPWYC